MRGPPSRLLSGGRISTLLLRTALRSLTVVKFAGFGLVYRPQMLCRPVSCLDAPISELGLSLGSTLVRTAHRIWVGLLSESFNRVITGPVLR